MILDKLKNAHLYYGLSGRIAMGLKFLQEHESELSKKEPGKYEIDGSNVFYLVQEYDTKPEAEGKYESHLSYIDIQYIVEGVEEIGYANIEGLKVTEDLSEVKDLIFYEASGDFVTVPAGYFAIFFPEDAHMPCTAPQKPEFAKKAVVKVRV